MTVSIGLGPAAHVDERPWGKFELLALNTAVSVKIITVRPRQRLSLQRHEHRDEWWTILDPGLQVELDGEPGEAVVGDRLWIPRGTTHRIGNSHRAPARFLEVAFGDFDERDIERLDDDYQRVPAPRRRR